MFIFILRHMLLISAICLSVISSANAQSGLAKHQGAYFEVTYPREFSVRTPDRNEAYLTSPNGRVEFFVYSPLWNGKPLTYLAVKPNEVLVDDLKSETVNDAVFHRHIQTTWATIEARDKSYTRSYIYQHACHELNTLNDCVSKAFGIKYANKLAYDQYRDAYIAFKNSLEQFSD